MLKKYISAHCRLKIRKKNIVLMIYVNNSCSDVNIGGKTTIFLSLFVLSVVKNKRVTPSFP